MTFPMFLTGTALAITILELWPYVLAGIALWALMLALCAVVTR